MSKYFTSEYWSGKPSRDPGYDKDHPAHTGKYWYDWLRSGSSWDKFYYKHFTSDDYKDLLEVTVADLDDWAYTGSGYRHMMDIVSGLVYNSRAKVMIWPDKVANWGGLFWHPLSSHLEGKYMRDFVPIVSPSGNIEMLIHQDTQQLYDAGFVWDIASQAWIDPDLGKSPDEPGDYMSGIANAFSSAVDVLEETAGFDEVADMIKLTTGVDLRNFMPNGEIDIDTVIFPALYAVIPAPIVAQFHAGVIIGRTIEEKLGIMSSLINWLIEEGLDEATLRGLPVNFDYNNIMARRRNYSSRSSRKRSMRSRSRPKMRRTTGRKSMRRMGVKKSVLPTKYRGLRRGSKVKPLKIDLWPSLVPYVQLAAENKQVVSFNRIDQSTGQPSDLMNQVNVLDILRGRVNDPAVMQYLVYEDADFQNLKKFVEENVKNSSGNQYDCKVTGVKFIIRSPLPEPCFIVSKINAKLNTNISDNIYKNKIYLRNKEDSDFAQFVMLAASAAAKANIKIYYRIKKKIELVPKTYYPTLNDVFFGAVKTNPIPVAYKSGEAEQMQGQGSSRVNA